MAKQEDHSECLPSFEEVVEIGAIIKTLSSNPPKYLYHYTTSDGLLGIIQNKSIHATHYKYLSDPTEFKNDEEEISRLTKGILSESEISDSVLDQNNINGEYLFSLSEDREHANGKLNGSISQWRAYADDGNGFCIAFKTYELVKCTSPWRFYTSEFARCQYTEEEKKLYFSKVKDLLAKAQNKPEHKQRMLRTARIMAGTFFKNECYKDEKEWRLVIAPNRSNNYIKFKKVNSTIKPYFEIKFGDELKNIIHSITIGPSQDAKCRHSIEMLCGTFGLEKDKIFDSNIPYKS